VVIAIEGRRKWLLGAIIGLGFGAVAIWMATAAAGGGHGTYLPAAILFPYSMVISAFLGNIPRALVVLAFVQYPIYGAVAALVQSPRRGWLALSCLHAAVALAASLLVAHSENFR
jgi:hypothetical protein